MVTKSKKASSGRKEKIKVLSLKKETVKDLTGAEAKKVKGGVSSIGALPSAYGSPTKSGGSFFSGQGHTYAGISGGKSTINFGPSL